MVCEIWLRGMIVEVACFQWFSFSLAFRETWVFSQTAVGWLVPGRFAKNSRWAGKSGV